MTASGFDAKLAEVENSVVLSKNMEIDRLNAELADKQRVINQRDKDWDALMLLLIETLGTEEERESPDDAVEEFDPWAALRAHTGLTAERDALRGEVERLRFYETTSAAEAIRELLAARPIVEAAKAWRADPIVDEESARRNHMHLSRLKHAIDAALAPPADTGAGVK